MVALQSLLPLLAAWLPLPDTPARPLVCRHAPHSVTMVTSFYDQLVKEREEKAVAAEQTSVSQQQISADLIAERELQAARRELQADLAARRRRASLVSLKQDVLALAARLNRGAGETNQGIPHAARAEMMALVEQLEALSPISEPLSAPEINGRWQLMYTTSASILGLNKRTRPIGPIYQTIDVPSLSARNDEVVVGPFGIRYRRFVKAELEPDTAVQSKVIVRFRRFGIGPLRIPAPKSAVGELDTTYLDSNLRISRGDKGNVFVLVKDDPLRNS